MHVGKCVLRLVKNSPGDVPERCSDGVVGEKEWSKTSFTVVAFVSYLHNKGATGMQDLHV